jgi:peptide/nickel transport system permease protein
MGTEQLGRDVFSRWLGGARSILAIAPAATLLAVVAGTTLGLLTGYLRGAVDDIVSRLTEAMLALPLIVIAVVTVVALGHSTLTLVVVVGVLFTPLVARTVRAAVLSERERDYVPAARLRGERAAYIMFAEILPNVTAPIIVEATVRLGYAIFTVAGLTFLGFGVQDPSPDWALQISDNYTLLAAGNYWWTVLFPALAIASLVIAINLIADGISQVSER